MWEGGGIPGASASTNTPAVRQCEERLFRTQQTVLRPLLYTWAVLMLRPLLYTWEVLILRPLLYTSAILRSGRGKRGGGDSVAGLGPVHKASISQWRRNDPCPRPLCPGRALGGRAEPSAAGALQRWAGRGAFTGAVFQVLGEGLEQKLPEAVTVEGGALPCSQARFEPEPPWALSAEMQALRV